MPALTGFNQPNHLNLTGFQEYKPVGFTEPPHIKKIKRTIMDLYVIPLKTGNWLRVNQNMFKFNKLMDKLKLYYETHNIDDLKMYIDLFQLISEMNGQYLGFSNNDELIKKGVAKLEESLPAIRLAPAYELYNLILGKPPDYNYDKSVIKHIQSLLENEEITYDEIKNSLN